MVPVRDGDAGLRGPGEQGPPSGLLSDRTSPVGKVAAVFGGSIGRQYRTVVVVLGGSWIIEAGCWPVPRVPNCDLGCGRQGHVMVHVPATASSQHPRIFFSDPGWMPQS